MDSLNFVQDISYHKEIARLDMVHHLLGNGLVQGIIQVTENRQARNALVLHMASPQNFEDRHKSDSYTFHQQVGPEMTLVGVHTAGDFYTTNPRQTEFDLQYGMVYDGGVPSFRASYPLDFTIQAERKKTPFNIKETIFCPAGHPALLRRITVTNQRGLAPQEATLMAFLVPNQSLFPLAHFLTEHNLAIAGQYPDGDEFLGLFSLTPHDGHQVAEFPIPFDDAADGVLANASPSAEDGNFVRPQEVYTNYPLLPGSPYLGPALALSFDLGTLEPGEAKTVDLGYIHGESEAGLLETAAALRQAGYDGAFDATAAYWAPFNRVDMGDPKLNELFTAVGAGLRASVAESGRMNAAIWGYNAEWVRDSSCASLGATLSGQFDMARAMLAHILHNLIGPEGLAYGESQFYEPRRAELDQNGEFMYALWMYWVHSRDFSLVSENWEKIVKIVEFLLLPLFWVEEVGMLKSERDQRDRDAERHGLRVGYELAHQMWASIAFEKGADMAEALGDGETAGRWRALGARIWESALTHPKFRLVEDGYLMKRRLLDGSFQRFAKVVPYVHRPNAEVMKVYPRNRDRGGELEPDGSEAWPIGKSMLDPQGSLAARTLLRMESLWNFEWDFGGYPLHHTGSEPTKLGSWLMIFYFTTQAAVEARHHHTVRRNLKWLLSTRDGRGYTWWEYRDADPALQIDHGIAPWFAFGEPVVLFVHHFLGFRPEPERIVIWPHLQPEMAEVQAWIKNGTHNVHLTVHNRGDQVARVKVDGTDWDRFEGEKVYLDLPEGDMQVEIWLADS